MLCFVRYLIANFVCLLFGARQVTYSGGFTAENNAMRVVRVNQNSEVAGR